MGPAFGCGASGRLVIVATTLIGCALGTGAAWAGNAADLDGDGVVGFGDFVILSRRFNQTTPVGDINGDGVVNFPDFLILSTNYQVSGIAPDPTLADGPLTLVVTEDLEASIRNDSGSTLDIMGCSFVTPNGVLASAFGSGPFTITLASTPVLVDVGNLGNAFSLAPGASATLDVSFSAAFEDLPDDLQFRFALAESDEVFAGNIVVKLAADLDEDGVVGFGDFVILSRRFNQTTPVGDIDGDGVVNFTDFLILSTNYQVSGIVPDPTLADGPLTLVVTEDLEASIRNDSGSTLDIMGCSFVTPNGVLASAFGSGPFTITLASTPVLVDVANLGNAFSLASGASATLEVSFSAAFEDLPDDLQFRFALAESDEVFAGNTVVPETPIDVTTWSALKDHYRVSRRSRP